jgi:hypothetical protein
VHPRSAGLAAVEAVDPRNLPAESSKPKTSKFSRSRAALDDLGKTTKPCWRCQRRTTCAGVRWCAAATSATTGSSSTAPRAIGAHASVTTPCRSPQAATSRFWKYGWSSIWFTAGTTSVSAASRSRCSTSKFETPIERARPSRASSSSTPQAATYPSGACRARGQWMRNRSTSSRPRVSSERAKLRRASSGRWFPLFSLVVTNTSSRARPEAATASPTPASLPYICAVSTCR